jgi:murein DD-endopeptidase MepM/ murein hydrolase activator NlpD
MRKLIIFFGLSLVLLPYLSSAQNQIWYYPISDFESRNQYKTFDQYWSKASYQGREALFPNQYVGYHVAADLEINPGEENQDVPVYAVTDGKITFAGPVTGYGGLILLDMANDSHTALYGHINLSSLKVKTGDSVKAGQKLAVLGKAFSSETGGERKHLHFGIYNGKGVYYHGYEPSEATVQSKWIDPAVYLKQKSAVEPGSQTGNTNQNSTISNQITNSNENISQTDNSQPPTQDLSIPKENTSFGSKIILFFRNIITAIGKL